VARARTFCSHGGTIADERPTILVIDDSQTFREELRSALEAAGYAVIVAPTARNGLKAAAAKRPTAIVVDGIMPGMDGTTLIRKVSHGRGSSRTPAILLTASEGSSAELRALDAGADAFVRKEEDMDVILARIGAVLRASTAQTKRARACSDRSASSPSTTACLLARARGMLRSEDTTSFSRIPVMRPWRCLAVQPVDCNSFGLAHARPRRARDLPAHQELTGGFATSRSSCSPPSRMQTR